MKLTIFELPKNYPMTGVPNFLTLDMRLQRSGPFDEIFTDLLSKQTSLGREFEEILNDNLWDLLVHTEDNHNE